MASGNCLDGQWEVVADTEPIEAAKPCYSSWGSPVFCVPLDRWRDAEKRGWVKLRQREASRYYIVRKTILWPVIWLKWVGKERARFKMRTIAARLGVIHPRHNEGWMKADKVMT